MINKILSFNKKQISFHNQSPQKVNKRPFNSPLDGVVLEFRVPIKNDTLAFGAAPSSLKSHRIKKSTVKALFETLGNFSEDIINKIKPYKPVIGDSGFKKLHASFKTALNPKSEIFKNSVGDLKFILEKDPALKEKDEKEAIIYKSLVITFAHRVAHDFYQKGETTIARTISEATKELTGAEIHPGAAIGSQIFVDHPSGLVIGERTIIGNKFHGHGNVLLGSDGVDTSKDRHPKIGNNVTIWPKASIHGGKYIGEGSIIGCGAVVTENVPPKSIIVGHNLLVQLKDKKLKLPLKEYWENQNKKSNVINLVQR